MVSDYLRISHLVSLYLHDKISAEEMAELLEWQKEYPLIKEWLNNKEERKFEADERFKTYLFNNTLHDWDRIQSKKKLKNSHKIKHAVLVAASVFLVICSGIWLFQKPAKTPVVVQSESSVVEPARQQARLILSNGKSVGLGQQQNLTIEEGDLNMTVEDKELDYTELASKHVYLHKIEVPRGGTYSLQLADGTKVWLNADSELEFPTSFPGAERVVSLKGEAYFEVAKNPVQPFKVQVNGITVEAVGTAFNINSHWKAGQVKTILTEGKIKVDTGEKAVFVNAGYASISEHGSIQIEKADVEEALAWRDGYFYFNGKTLKEITDEVARWYNLSLKYEMNTSNDTYKGGMKRTESIESICGMLRELTGFDLQVQGRTLFVRSQR